MTSENKAFLEANRHYVLSYSQADPPLKMSYRDRERLYRIVKEDFDPAFVTDLWCDPCVKSLVLNAYIFYDQFLKDEKGE